MSSALLPRLPEEIASKLRNRICSEGDTESAVYRASYMESLFAEQALFPSTGGHGVPFSDLSALRLQVTNAVAPFVNERGLTDPASFDLIFGRTLYTWGRSAEAELGDPRVWDFLTLVVFPDLATARFAPHGPEAMSRFTGGHRRHVFQRLWHRWRAIGIEIVESARLTEDDFAILLERKLFSDQPQVARIAADLILQFGPSSGARREYARRVTKRFVQLSGIVHVGEDAEELSAIAAHIVETAHEGS